MIHTKRFFTLGFSVLILGWVTTLRAATTAQDKSLSHALTSLLREQLTPAQLAAAATEVRAINADQYRLDGLLAEAYAPTAADGPEVLKLVELLGHSGASPAYPVLLGRISGRNYDHWRLEQFTVADVKALVDIADQQPPAMREHMLLVTQALLLNQIRVFSAHPAAQAALMWGFKYLPRMSAPSPKGWEDAHAPCRKAISRTEAGS